MQENDIRALTAWLAEAGLRGESEETLIRGFGERCLAAGAPLIGARVLVDTLHPLYEGRAFSWFRDAAELVVFEYGDSSEGVALERWRTTPFYSLQQSGGSHLVLDFDDPAVTGTTFLDELREAGAARVLFLVDRFGEQGGIGPADCLYSAWATDALDFAEADLEAMLRLSPLLALALKTASLGRIAHTLVETYLGRDAGRRVLSGRIARGVAEEIKTVLWFSDLRDYTRISDASPPELLIPMLNAYADVVVSAIHHYGGDVLKLIGDGVLAIFPAAERRAACQAALAAAAKARDKVAALNHTRIAEGLPATGFYLGLHIGHVFYGNIGSRERLDFTVIGPAVNEVSRIASMCRSVDQSLLMSSAFVQGLARERNDFLSVGRFALRGVAAPQELFTLDPTSLS
jgi:adenylate cyclase